MREWCDSFHVLFVVSRTHSRMYTLSYTCLEQLSGSDFCRCDLETSSRGGNWGEKVGARCLEFADKGIVWKMWNTVYHTTSAPAPSYHKQPMLYVFSLVYRSFLPLFVSCCTVVFMCAFKLKELMNTNFFETNPHCCLPFVTLREIVFGKCIRLQHE